MTLYDLQEEYRALLELAEDPETDPQMFADTLEALDGEIEAKADGYAAVMAQLSGDADAIKKQIDRLKDRKKVIDSNISRMKEALQNAMITTGKRKIKTTLFSFNIQKNPPRLVMETTDYTKIPAEYWKMLDPEIDEAAIKKKLQAGEKMPGVAHLEQSEGLRIR